MLTKKTLIRFTGKIKKTAKLFNIFFEFQIGIVNRNGQNFQTEFQSILPIFKQAYRYFRAHASVFPNLSFSSYIYLKIILLKYKHLAFKMQNELESEYRKDII